MTATVGATEVSTPSEREIRIERVFAAPRELVWQAFTDPALVARWWGRGHALEIVRDEVTPGGHWRYVEDTPEGPVGFEGRYSEVTPPERLVRTFEWDGQPGHVSLEDATFQDLGDRTGFVATTLFMTREDRDGMMASGMQEGMNEGYAAQDAELATLV